MTMKVIYPDNYLNSVSATEEDSEYPATNVQNDYIKKPWKATSNDATLTLSILGGAGAIALFGTNTTDINVKLGVASLTWETGVSWETGTQWNTLLDNFESISSHIDSGGDGAMWIVYDAPKYRHDMQLKLSTIENLTLQVGVVKAGSQKLYHSPDLGFQEGLKDFSIVKELNNGAYYTRKRDVVRTFNGRFLIDRNPGFWHFMVELFKNVGPRPLAWFFAKEDSVYWLVYARANGQMPSGQHNNPKMSTIDLQLIEVI